MALFRHGSKVRQCYVCHRNWYVLESIRSKRGVYLQVYECQKCLVRVTLGATVLHAESLRDRPEEAYEWMARTRMVVLGQPRRWD